MADTDGALHPRFADELLEAFGSAKSGGWDFGFGPTTRGKSEFGAGARDRESLALMFWQPLRKDRIADER